LEKRGEGEPATTGIYNGAPISIAISSSVEAADGEFCAFVILKETPVPAVLGDEPRLRLFEMPSMTKVSVTLHDWEQEFTIDPETSYKSGHEGMMLAAIIQCAACGKEIPAPPVPANNTPDQKRDALKNYKCPFCGHNACLIADSVTPSPSGK